jgi:glycosyltransferase involved in cell wall biosynthesis
MRKDSGRLRILAVIASSELGGAERVFASLLKGLDRDQFEVWAACHGEGPMVEEYRQHASGVWVLDLRNILNPGTVIALARLMRQLKCQIVHTNLWTADVLGGLTAALTGVPIRVATVHGEYFTIVEEEGLRRARKIALSKTFRSIYRLFDRVIGVSRSVATDLLERPGLRVNPRKVAVIRNGLDLSRILVSPTRVDRRNLGLSPTAPVLIAVANFFPYKGHRWLLEAMPHVLQVFPEAMLLLAGDGNALPAIQRQIQHRRLDRNVRITGPRRDALELIALSDVVVLPSVSSEGPPIVALEALALGKPVVATRVGGIPEVIEDGKTGLLVAPRDPRALADAILAVLSNPALAKSLGENGREVVRARFSAERMVRQTEQLYLDLAAAKGISAYGGG